MMASSCVFAETFLFNLVPIASQSFSKLPYEAKRTFNDHMRGKRFLQYLNSTKSEHNLIIDGTSGNASNGIVVQVCAKRITRRPKLD